MVMGGSGNDTVYSNTGTGTISVAGGSGDDVFHAGDHPLTVMDRPGNETIYGGTASLMVTGGSGNDTVYGVGVNVDPVTHIVTYTPVASGVTEMIQLATATTRSTAAPLPA